MKKRLSRNEAEGEKKEGRRGGEGEIGGVVFSQLRCGSIRRRQEGKGSQLPACSVLNSPAFPKLLN